MESVKFAAPVDTAEWKKKKNYKPAALFTVLLLGTAFLAGNSYANYGSSAPTGSLSATDVMSFLDTVPSTRSNDCHGKSQQSSNEPCVGDREHWSVVGLKDGGHCLTDSGATTICGQVCLSRTAGYVLNMIQDKAPDPKPVKGNCAMHGYSYDTNQSFALARAAEGIVGDYARAEIFTKKQI